MERGLVHIYTGDGKGKTTAAFGLAARCAGYGKKVIVYQFLKSMPTGELISCKKLGIDVIRTAPTDKFWFSMTDDEKELTKSETERALEHIFDSECDMLILDEIICTADLGIIRTERLIDIIKSKPLETELILTGRNMPSDLENYADYISEIRCIKHPYSQNINAREGIDF